MNPTASPFKFTSEISDPCAESARTPLRVMPFVRSWRMSKWASCYLAACEGFGRLAMSGLEAEDDDAHGVPPDNMSCPHELAKTPM